MLFISSLIWKKKLEIQCTLEKKEEYQTTFSYLSACGTRCDLLILLFLYHSLWIKGKKLYDISFNGCTARLCVCLCMRARTRVHVYASIHYILGNKILFLLRHFWKVRSFRLFQWTVCGLRHGGSNWV